MTATQVAARHFSAQNTAANRLANLVSAGFVHVERPRYRGRAAYLATPLGARLAGVGLPAAHFFPSAARHRLAVVDMAHALVSSRRGAAG